MFWLRNKKIKFSLRTLNLSPVILFEQAFTSGTSSMETDNMKPD